jgi:hypothetical protein
VKDRAQVDSTTMRYPKMIMFFLPYFYDSIGTNGDIMKDDISKAIIIKDTCVVLSLIIGSPF